MWSARGFGLVELMIAVVLGMMSTIIIFQVFATFEGRQRTTTSQMNATESGLMGLLAIEREARHAGHGLVGFGRGSERQIICRNVNRYQGGGLVTEALMPARLIDGGAGQPDAVEISYGTSVFAATPARLVVDAVNSDPAAELVVANAARGEMFAAGDAILVSEPAIPTKPCTLLRVTGQTPDVAGIRLAHASTNVWNPPTGTNIFPVAPTLGYRTTTSNPALVVNVGTFMRSLYRINGEQLELVDLLSGAVQTVADDIVSMQAQYGITSSALSQDIAAWVNPTGAWAAPAASDVARIKAIRVAVVARSSQPEREDVTAATCVTRGGTTSTGPCAWIDDTPASPAPTMDLASFDPDWRRFRYRVYETVVPLRNVIWGDVNQ
ncbi:MAG: PilW family protein [Burkholderiales bacterium]